jgi:hypothetical protein
MSQNRESGAAAANWGLDCGRRLAASLGATRPTGNSNACRLEGKSIVIKCAAITTDSVGVTFKMLEQLEEIVGAFQLAEGSFDVWALTAAQYRQAMRDTASHGASAGRVGIVRKAFFEQHGRHIGRIRPKE